jgi:hypothetical protein
MKCKRRYSDGFLITDARFSGAWNRCVYDVEAIIEKLTHRAMNVW